MQRSWNRSISADRRTKKFEKTLQRAKTVAETKFQNGFLFVKR